MQIIGIIPTFSSNKSQENVFTIVKNSLRAYPKSNITFNLLPHLELDEEQKCIIDNLWISFGWIFNNQTNKSLDRKYFITCVSCDAPKPGCPLTTCQPAEYSWMSGNPTPLIKIGQSLLCTRSSTQGTKPVPTITMTTQGPHASKIMATWAPASILTKYINYIQ